MTSDLVGSRWTRRSPKGDSLDHVQVSALFEIGDGHELVITTVDGHGFPTGVYENRYRSDRNGDNPEVVTVERRVNARTVTPESFVNAYSRDENAAEIAKADDAMRSVLDRLNALEVK